MAALLVRDCGPMTSLQDLGRIGTQRFGVSRSGAMDRLALAHANALTGNPVGTGAVEFMLAGGAFLVEDGPLRLGTAGAAALAIDGRPIPAGSSATALPSQIVSVGPAKAGIYTYLAIGGGLDVATDLGSVSLQPRAGIGGLGGRPLRAGDRLPARAASPPAGPELTLPPPPFDEAAPIRVVLGPQDDHFDAAAIAAFLGTTYRVSAEADRMGYRLTGPPIAHLRGFNIVSDGIVAGSIQVPGSGVPIVMMADHQTTGGYPKIATLVSADLRVLAQRRPGSEIRFRAVAIEEAQAIARTEAAAMADLPGRAEPLRGGLPDAEALLALNLAGAATDALAGEP